jgi:hypothetical protein
MSEVLLEEVVFYNDSRVAGDAVKIYLQSPDHHHQHPDKAVTNSRSHKVKQPTSVSSHTTNVFYNDSAVKGDSVKVYLEGNGGSSVAAAAKVVPAEDNPMNKLPDKSSFLNSASKKYATSAGDLLTNRPRGLENNDSSSKARQLLE